MLKIITPLITAISTDTINGEAIPYTISFVSMAAKIFISKIDALGFAPWQRKKI